MKNCLPLSQQVTSDLYWAQPTLHSLFRPSVFPRLIPFHSPELPKTIPTNSPGPPPSPPFPAASPTWPQTNPHSSQTAVTIAALSRSRNASCLISGLQVRSPGQERGGGICILTNALSSNPWPRRHLTPKCPAFLLSSPIP